MYDVRVNIYLEVGEDHEIYEWNVRREALSTTALSMCILWIQLVFVCAIIEILTMVYTAYHHCIASNEPSDQR